MDIENGPAHRYGNLTQILSAPGQGQASAVVVNDPNSDHGPCIIYQGDGLPDIRYTYLKDKVAGYTGVVAANFNLPFVHSIDQIPAQFATQGLAGAQAVVNGVAMTLAGASTGFTPNIPIIPFAGFGGVNSGSVVTTGMALDFGFQFGTVTSGSTTIVVADSTVFIVGMPLVIGGVGNAAGTLPLLTNVASITDATHIVTVDTPQASLNPAPIGTGNLWGPSENGFPTPTAALPYLSQGPGLFFDPQQGVCRGVQIGGTGGGNAGGTFTVSGYDVYGMQMSETITVASGVAVGFGKKAFKYIGTITPNFSDGANTYVAGTSDVFGFCVRSDKWEYTNVCWAGAFMTSSTGWLTSVTAAATPTTGDVRGTIQTGLQGGGSGIGTTPSNGTVSSLQMSGNRLVMFQSMPMFNIIRGTGINTKTMYGNTQA